MTSKADTLAKVEEMITDVSGYLVKEAERLYSSGGIDPDSYGDDYVLPKTLLAAALLNCSEQYTWGNKEEIDNLKHF